MAYAWRLFHAPCAAATLRQFRGTPRAARQLRVCCQAQANESAQLRGTAAERQLQRRLDAAVRAEDFAQAAAVRDELMALRLADPVLVTRAQLEQAISSERWSDAVRLRDQLTELEPPPPPPARVPCSSSSTAQGVSVHVTSRWVRTDESARKNVFLYTYEVTFVNESQTPVQLLARHWIITDGTGRVEHVRGPGVIGQQPVLGPGETFTYSSFCPLRTTSGTMAGEFGFVQLVKSDRGATPKPGRPFELPVARFGLSVEGTDAPLPPMREEEDTERLPRE